MYLLLSKYQAKSGGSKHSGQSIKDVIEYKQKYNVFFVASWDGDDDEGIANFFFLRWLLL